MQEFNVVSLVPLIVIILVFYFLVIRPQQTQRKKHIAMVSGLKRGDRIVTNGGLMCDVINQEEHYILVRLGGESVRLAKDYVAYKVDDVSAQSSKADDKSQNRKEAGRIEYKSDRTERKEKASTRPADAES